MQRIRWYFAVCPIFLGPKRGTPRWQVERIMPSTPPLADDVETPEDDSHGSKGQRNPTADGEEFRGTDDGRRRHVKVRPACFLRAL